jgi:hypothetical protein
MILLENMSFVQLITIFPTFYGTSSCNPLNPTNLRSILINCITYENQGLDSWQGSKDFSLLHSNQTSTGAHTDIYSTGSVAPVSLWEWKQPGMNMTSLLYLVASI